jgi:type IV pilus assembly protein PilC
MTMDDFLLQRARVSGKRHKRVTMDDKMTFFQQLGSLQTAGIPLLDALRIAAEQCQSDRLTSILRYVNNRVASGSSLEQALAEQRGVFEDHWVALIGTGEATGKMSQVLEDLNSQIREAQAARNKVVGALVYPAVLMVVACLVVVIMLWFVVPTFGDMFTEMNAELPGLTKAVLAISDTVGQYGLYTLISLAVLVFLVRRYLQTDAGKRRLTTILLALPLFGELTVQSAMYRFSSNLALLLKSGVPIMDALSALAGIFRSNPPYHDAMRLAQSRVGAGRPLADSLVESNLFTAMMTNTVRVGEESAQLANVMSQIAPYYREKSASRMSTVSKLLEPCIIVVMGFMIALLMLAIYMPMFEMSGKMN